MLDILTAEPLLAAFIFLLVVILALLWATTFNKDDNDKEARNEELIKNKIKESGTGDLSEIRSQREEWESIVKERLLSVDPETASLVLRTYRDLVRKELRKEIHDEVIRASIDGNPLSPGIITLRNVATWVASEKSEIGKKKI